MTGGQFDEETYANLMLGYVQLTDPEKIVGGSDLSPSEDIVSAFTAAPYDKVKRVVAGVSAAGGGFWRSPVTVAVWWSSWQTCRRTRSRCVSRWF